MQQGLAFLWLLVIGVSFVMGSYLKVSQVLGGRLHGRRQITGCELARQVLDRHHQNRTAITPVLGRARAHLGFSLDYLRLAEQVYYGTRLSDVAQALHETMHHLESARSPVPTELRAPGGRFFQGVVIVSWLLVLGGFLLQGWGGVTRLGQMLLLLAFFLALASLPEEWEVTDRALSHLALMEGFGTDEKVRMKQLLKIMRWIPLAEILKAPWNLIHQGVNFGVPKSQRVH